MDDFNDLQTNQEEQTNVDEEFELSHSDKLVGVFTEPVKTFEQTAKFPAKTTDWLLPVILLIVVSVLAQIVMMSNPAIKFSIQQKQMTSLEKRFDKMVKQGVLTKEQAKTKLDSAREFIEKGSGATMVLRIIGTIIAIFIFFFIIAGVFHLFAKFVLKGEGGYSSTMTAYGLSFYISIVQVIVMVIVAMIMNKFLADLSLASLIGADKSNFGGFLLGKVDIFSIWFYAVFSIGLAKMHKAKSMGKYFVMVYGLWIGFSIIIFFVAKAVPLLGSFAK